MTENRRDFDFPRYAGALLICAAHFQRLVVANDIAVLATCAHKYLCLHVFLACLAIPSYHGLHASAGRIAGNPFLGMCLSRYQTQTHHNRVYVRVFSGTALAATDSSSDLDLPPPSLAPHHVAPQVRE